MIGLTVGGDALGSPNPLPLLSPEVAPVDSFPADLCIDSPYLQFYDIETAAGGHYRVIGFADPDSAGAPGTIAFDGEDYTTLTVERSEFQEATDGSIPSIGITVADPFGNAAAFVRENDLLDADVTWTLIKLENIATPSLREDQRRFRLLKVSLADGPRRLQVQLGPPDLIEQRFPVQQFSRPRCPLPNHSRFIHDGVTNLCSAGSSEFLRDAVIKPVGHVAASDSEVDTGAWYYANGAEFDSQARAGQTYAGSADKALYLLNKRLDMRWEDANRNGLFVYRKIGDVTGSDTDFDINVKLTEVASTKDEWMTGILVQSEDDVTNWAFWGPAENASSVDVLRRRTTQSDVSTTNDHTLGTYTAFRLRRVGTTLTFFARVEDTTVRTFEDDDAAAWTEVAESTGITLDGNLRLGVVAASDSTAIDDRVDAYIHHYRLTAGGPGPCAQDFAACQARRNTDQFSGFLGMPDGTLFL